MGFLDRLLGRDLTPKPDAAKSADELAVEGYERLLSAAPTDTIERAHVEAFERLTPEQLALLFDRFTANADEAERVGKAVVRPADAARESLAKAAAEAESKEPGVLKRLFGYGVGVPAAAVLGGSMFVILAGYVIASHPAADFMAGDDGLDAGSGGDHAAGPDSGLGDHGAGGADDSGLTGIDFGSDVTGFDLDF